jgi:hypothetical protein
MNHDRVTFTGVRKKRLQLGPFSILAGGFVGEDSVDAGSKMQVSRRSIRTILSAQPGSRIFSRMAAILKWRSVSPVMPTAEQRSCTIVAVKRC